MIFLIKIFLIKLKKPTTTKKIYEIYKIYKKIIIIEIYRFYRIKLLITWDNEIKKKIIFNFKNIIHKIYKWDTII